MTGSFPILRMACKSSMLLESLDFLFIGPGKTNIFFASYFEQVAVYFTVLLGIRLEGFPRCE